MKKHGQQWLVYLVSGFGILLVNYIFFMILAPASAKVHLRLNQWQYDQATFLLDAPSPKLILQASSAPGYRSPTIGALHLIDLDQGTKSGSIYLAGKINVRGVSDSYVWIKPRGRSLEGRNLNDLSDRLFPEKLLEAYPDILTITEKIGVEGTDNRLRIIGLDGNHYQWHPDKGSPKKNELPSSPDPSLSFHQRRTKFLWW
ncbi:MAG: hypothetical protein AAF598_17480 [Bacteroidota bacterium]